MPNVFDEFGSFERRSKKMFRIGKLVVIFWILASFILSGTALYVIFHFISKFW